MSERLVKKNAKVKQGQKIGLVGNTGGNYANHLHFDWSGGSAWKMYYKDNKDIKYNDIYSANLFYYDYDANSKAYCDWFKAKNPKKAKQLEKEMEKLVHTINGGKYSLRSKNKAIYLGPVDSSVKNLTIPATITFNKKTYDVNSIGSHACIGLKNLQTVTIGNKVKTICSSAFEGCTSLTTVTIGSNVSSIEARAFYGCSSLKTIILNTTKLTDNKIQNKAFSGISGQPTFKCPSTVLKKYKKFLPKETDTPKKVKVETI